MFPCLAVVGWSATSVAAPPADEGFSFEDGTDESPPEDDGFSFDDSEDTPPDNGDDGDDDGDDGDDGDEFIIAPVDAPESGETTGEPPGDDEWEDAWEDDGALSEDSGFTFEDISEDQDALDAELKSGEVQAKGTVGTVSGVVLNAKREPLAGVYVRAKDTKYVGRTGVDGAYTLQLPPGQYTLLVELDLYQSAELTAVDVSGGEVTTHDVELVPMVGVMETFEVSDSLNLEAEGALQESRKQKTSVNDGIDATEMSKSGGGKASSVAVRIVGATIVDGRYLFVRGLGHRYGNTLLDGARVPSPEPEIRTVPLDVIPSGALSAIDVQKTFTPDVPGDFTGGSTQFVTRNAPDDPMITIGVTAGVNTNTSFQPMVTHAGHAGYDLFALGNLPRARPDSFPSDERVGRGVGRDAAQVEADGKALDTRTRVMRGARAPANFGFKLSAGDSWSLNDAGAKFGILFAGGYKNEHQTNRETVRLFGLRDGVPDISSPRVDLESIETVYTTNYNGLLKLQFDANPNNRWALTGFYSREGQDETRDMYGEVRDVSPGEYLNYTRLRYVMRSIASVQLSGKHKIPRAANLEIDYFGSFAQARRDDPALREMLFRDTDGAGSFEIDNGAGATGSQLFLGLVDNNENAGLDLSLPFRQWKGLDAKLKFGAWLDAKQRSFFAPRYDYAYATGVAIPAGRDNPINDDTIGGGLSADNGGTRPFTLWDRTRAQDGYEAWSRNLAGYASLDLPFVNWFRVSGGARLESNVINVTPVDPFAGPNDTPFDSSRLVDLDVLPAASLIFSPPLPEGGGDFNIRVNGTKTLARPEFRELAPFSFRDYVGGFNKQGFPGLTSTHIWNADLRFEWFPRSAEVVAISGFFKHFQDPIEEVVGAGSNPAASFANVDSAINGGVELEFRKALDFLAPKPAVAARKVLRDLSIGANFAYIYSQVQLGPPCHRPGEAAVLEGSIAVEDCRVEYQVSTSRERPLQGQAPWIANAYIDYDNAAFGTNLRLMYNAVGPYIAQVSGLGLPDIYQEPMHMLDFTASQRLLAYKRNEWGDLRNQLLLTLEVENMLNTRRYRTQGDQLVYSTRDGLSFTVGLTWKY
ncbi:TonB-dependent receptor [Enhygromyxa salina]|uniref:TonB-dependent receptor n=1 Tax=Enhygromyxa salina TaxID=215803 RepID=A0A0C1ZRF5_9BACT|nr:TonB-dependent receptor [Enhygromyxa salina]